MRFWDTSAIVPLCVSEPVSPLTRRLAESDPSLAVWWASRTECLSALVRRRREGHFGPTAEKHACRALEALAREWSEVLPTEALRKRAERLLGVHPLRAADAFQLAAALVWSRGETRGHHFICFDERLRAAARREGFLVLPE